VIVPPGLKRGANRRLAGEDVAKGSVALHCGRRLQPQDLSMAAALGLQVLPVRRRIRVAIFSTGDEIVEPGAPLPAAALYDANRELLQGLLARLDAEVSDLGILRDDPATLSAKLAEAAQRHDLVLTSGGVSTGEADYVKDAIGAAGSLVFWRVAIKPGRPVAMGVLRGAAFVGLPGNPVAVFVTFARVVRPLLLRLAGANPEPLVALPVISAFAYRKKKGRREYVRVVLTRRPDGSYEAHKHPQDGAGVISSLTATDGLAELDDDVTEIAVGQTIGFLPLDLAQVLDRNCVAQLLAQRDLPQPDHRMAPVARMRAGEWLVLCHARGVQPCHDSPPMRSAACSPRPSRGRRECRRGDRQNPARCRPRSAVGTTQSAPGRHSH
jgi:molybdopterin molybdotransferase